TEIANQLGISPLEIRKINGFRDGDRTSANQELMDVGLLKTLEVIEPIYEQRKKELAASKQKAPVKRGLGIACLGYGIGYSGVRNPSCAVLKVAADGMITIYSGTPDIGTGSDMAMSQIAADALDVDLKRIRIISGDSSKTEDSGPTSASRTTYFSGNAIRYASEDFIHQFSTLVARQSGCEAKQVKLVNDEVRVGENRLDFEAACRLIIDEIDSIEGYGKFDPDISVDITTFKGNPYATYTYATHLVEIEVDEELGSVRVPRVWAAHDGGVIVNPVGAEGQVEGGIAMGIGMALYEKIVRDEGYIMNPNYRDYLLPGSMDIPERIEITFVDNYDRTGPYGAKGIAEASLIPIPAAIASALTEAVGVRPRSLPMESEKILKLMGEN
ncbi:MAG: molybdopterin-dependent oxidoreductase, partial [Gammaproteobacteria bacterium]|nr:molybdopterin-dependent oxidoreductase [Gammaproteobacteria bacterium]